MKSVVSLKRENFISQYPPLNFLNREDVEKIWNKGEVNLYVHIPYCAKKCDFCYYKSFSIGDGQVPEEYLDALKKEIELYSKTPQMQGKVLRSIYIGGGTPTMLTEEQLSSLVCFIYSRFETAKEDFEFCCEARPGPNTTLEKLELLESLGLRRLSLGCQSLDDEILQVNGRHHNAAEFYNAFELSRKAGIDCVNVDLMSGLVNHSMESWVDTIKRIIGLKPENVSIYKMELYLNNALYSSYREGGIRLVSDSDEVLYIREGYKRLLEGGYTLADNYSFMSDPRYRHVQRREVWKGKDMLGIGLSAHSCFNGCIYQNESLLSNYMERLKRDEIPVYRAHKISSREHLIRRVIFGIKNLHLDRKGFEEEFGIDVMSVFGEQLVKMQEDGFIRIYHDYIETTVEGAIFSDDFVRELYLPEHRKMALAHVKRPE